jgi:hypothetical protein
MEFRQGQRVPVHIGEKVDRDGFLFTDVIPA